VLPCQFEPEVGANPSNDSDGEQGGDLSLSNEEIDNELESAKSWRFQNLSWRKSGRCANIPAMVVEWFLS
jgi:hypothetical protein